MNFFFSLVCAANIEWIETIYNSCFCRLSQLELINLSWGPQKTFLFFIMTLNIPVSFYEMLLFIFDHEMLVQQFKAGRSRTVFVCFLFKEIPTHEPLFLSKWVWACRRFLSNSKRYSLLFYRSFVFQTTTIKNNKNKKQWRQH